MLSDDQIEATILLKLHRQGNWRASHTAFDNLQKGFKDADLGKHGGKRVEGLARKLVRQGWVLSHPTSYGLQVSLNPRQSEEILAFVRRHFPDV